MPVLTTAEQQTSGRLLGPPSLDDFGWDREAGPDAPLVGPWFGDHSFGEVRVSGAGGGLVFEAFGFGDQPSMLLASACREVTKTVPSGVVEHVSRTLGGMGEHELWINVVFDGRASRADLVRAMLGFVTHPSPAAYRENPVHLRVADRSGNTPDMTTGPQPAAAPVAAGELYPPPAADLLELIAKCGSTSAEERLEAATLMGRVGSGDTRSTQLAQSRLTQLLLDRSPAVVEAAWNSLGVLAEQDNELAATLRVLTRVCATRHERVPTAGDGPSSKPGVDESASPDSLPAVGASASTVRRLTVEQAAERLGVSKPLVQRYAQQKRIGELIGRQYLFSEAELDEFAKKPRPTGRPRDQSDQAKSEENAS